MAYLIIDVDVERPLDAVVVDDPKDGLAIIVRRHGRPIGFLMESVAPGTTIAAETVGAWIVRNCALAWLADAVLWPAGSSAPELAPPSLTLAVCSKDRPYWLDRCLRSLAAIREKAERAGRPVDVLVVDNASIDQQGQLVASHHGARYVFEPRLGLDFARNRALDEAKTEWLAFLDDDVVVDPGWIDGLAHALRLHPDSTVVTGQVLPFRLDTEAQVLFERHGGFRKGFERRRYGPIMPGSAHYPAGAGYFGTGANMVVRVDSARALGGFDEALDTGSALPGGGDLDLFYRVIRSGGVIVYEPRCLVFHEHRREMAALRRQYGVGWGTSYMAFWAKCYKSDPGFRRQNLRSLAAWMTRILHEVVASAAGRTDRPPDLVLAEALGGVLGICGAYDRSVRRSERIRRLHA